MDINSKENFFFDLDGTIWDWNSFKTGASDLLQTLESAGKNIYFYTDNTLLSRNAYAQKLARTGFETNEKKILTSGYTASRKLATDGTTKVYACGESGLTQEIEKQDIKLSEKSDTAVIGLDRKFNYSKLEKIKRISEKGRVIVCSGEKTFQKDGDTKIHQEPINKAISEFTDVKNIGKPSEAFRKSFKKYFNYLPNNSILIGDQLSDIQTGNKLGLDTALVLDNEQTEYQLKNAEGSQVPTYALTSLEKLKRRII